MASTVQKRPQIFRRRHVVAHVAGEIQKKKEKKKGHVCNHLNLGNPAASVQLHFLGDPHSILLGNATTPANPTAILDLGEVKWVNVSACGRPKPLHLVPQNVFNISAWKGISSPKRVQCQHTKGYLFPTLCTMSANEGVFHPPKCVQFQ